MKPTAAFLAGCLLVHLIEGCRSGPSISLLDREAATRWDEKRDAVLGWEDSPRLSDHDVGIREWVRSAERRQRGTGGMLKASWSDFRVTEVSAATKRPIQLSQASDPGPRPPGAGFLRLVMAKIGYDTISAVGRICTWLGVDRGAVTYAGIKDKSAVTCQALSIDCRAGKLDIDRLRSISSWIPRVMVGEFEWTSEKIVPGMHAGNYFTILLRDMSDHGAQHAQEAVASVRRRGFVNYYGHQRFGLAMRSSMPTIEVGKALLQGNWDAAIALVMSTKYVSHPAELAAKKGFSERWRRAIDLPLNTRRERIRQIAADALSSMPAHCFGEISMLRALSQNKTARQSLFAMPHRAMYMLAYWSALWNRIASRRIQIFGAKHAAEGDLVAPVGDVYGASDGKMNVSVVTAREARLKRYSIRDVVLPLPGRDVQLVVPQHTVGVYIINLLKKEGVYDLVCGEAARQPHPWLKPRPQTARQCLFRHMVVVPDSLEHTLLPYADDGDLVVCDDPSGGHFASLAAPRAPPSPAHAPGAAAAGSKRTQSRGKERRKRGAATRSAVEEGSELPAYGEAGGGNATAHPDNGRWALQLRFGLPPAAFATMLVREITMESTHPALHCEKRRHQHQQAATNNR